MTVAVALASRAPSEEGRRLHVIQGRFVIADEPDVVLTTILGSCVSACLLDPEAGVGGMNHFLLPGGEGGDGLRYGVNAMELLINALLRRGARRERLEAKLFGGARLFDGLTDVGEQNAAFAKSFLADEGIRHVGGSLGGVHARRIQFWPVGGRARQIQLADATVSVLSAERARAPAPERPADGVELF